MALNYIWIFFVISAFIIALLRGLIGGEWFVMQDIVDQTFVQARNGFEYRYT